MASTFDSASTENYHLHRMLLGVPEGPGEIVPGSALPLESCMDVQGGGPCKPVSPMDDQTDRMTSVDFRKGCYLGQELTVRTYHTGATRKRILPIRLFPLDNPPTHLSSILPPSDPSNTGPSVGTGAGTEITYHPPASSASKKPRSAGRILSLHPSVTSVGLGLVRLEMVERTRWAGTVVDWMEGEGGRLLANVGGEEWGVWVGRGEAFGAIMEEVEIEAGTS